MNNENLTIGFIGAGRVGFTLARYFFEKNFSISGFYSRNYEHSCDAADFTCSKAYKTINELVRNSNIIFLTVSDSSIHEVYLQLKNCELTDKILCHCSGALSAEVFDDISSTGAYGYSVHPAFAISDKRNSYKEISKAFFTIEGSETKMYVLKEIFTRLGNPFQIISSENKCKYHASLVMSSNLVIGLYHIALKMLRECGFSDSEAVKVLNPLFLNNAENICNYGYINSLTGPVDRNDTDTVKKHLAAIEDNANKEIYELLSSELIKIGKEKYLKNNFEELENLLNEESNLL